MVVRAREDTRGLTMNQSKEKPRAVCTRGRLSSRQEPDYARITGTHRRRQLPMPYL